MRFAYADPPYIGQAKRHYQSEEVDHEGLLGVLCRDFPDGWALSCSVPSLPFILSLKTMPDQFRIGAWVKPFAIFKPNVNPGYCWEPVIFYGGRKRTREQPTLRDFVSCNVTLKKGLVGAKPEGFCFWVFDFLGMLPSDTLVDLFPGTGAVTRAWQKWAAGKIEGAT